MNRRQLLRIGVKSGLLAGVIAFAFVFIQGLLSPGQLSGNALDLSGIPPGGARLDAWNGKSVWIVNRSETQQEALRRDFGYLSVVPDTDAPQLDNPFRSLRKRYGVYLAETSRTGILVQYVQDRPPGLSLDVPWAGGFVDPASGALFDTAGRPHPSSIRAAPLAIPPHRYTSDREIRFGDW